MNYYSRALQILNLSQLKMIKKNEKPLKVLLQSGSDLVRQRLLRNVDLMAIRR